MKLSRFLRFVRLVLRYVPESSSGRWIRRSVWFFVGWSVGFDTGVSATFDLIMSALKMNGGIPQ